MPIKPARIERDLNAFAQFGRSGPTAVTRLALTPADRAARAHLIDLCRAEGMQVRIDRFGNIAAILGDWDRPALLLGSHLDSVPNGGRFDGVVGVVAALEVVRALKEDGHLPPVPVGVVNFTAEESSRWGRATLGSKGLAGVIPADELMAYTDRDGITFGQALQENAGYDLVGGPCDFGPIAGFFEMHIEQGPELLLASKPVGVVTHIAAPSRYKVFVRGLASHSGSTLMGRRKDGLVAAAELVLGLERIAKEVGDAVVATATVFSVKPVSINVIPGEVELGIDIRGIDKESIGRVTGGFRKLVAEVSARRALPIEVETLSEEEPVTLDPHMVEYLSQACERKGIPFLAMPSRAGHDAMYVARVAPAAMLFVPSKDGLSHNPAEFTALEEIALGAEVLAEAVRALR